MNSLQFDLDTLEGAVKWAGRVIPGTPIMPILNGILFEPTGDETVRLTATNLDTTTRVTIPFAGALTDSFVIRKGTLLNMLKRAPDEVISVDLGNEKASVQSGRAKIDMPLMEADDFPTPHGDNGIKQVGHIDAEALQPIHGLLSSSVSQDELRPVMKHIYLENKPNGLRFVATNGHVMTYATLEGCSMNNGGPMLVLPEALATVLREADEEIIIRRSSSAIWFVSGRYGVATRITDESYPNYQAVIPNGHNREATVNAHEMSDAVELVGVAASSTAPQVRCTFDGDELVIQSENVQRRTEGEHVIELEAYDGDPITIGFNPEYLRLVVGAADGPVKLFLKSPSRAAVVEAEHYNALVMPIMLNEATAS